MRKIILCVLLFASFIFALNCEPLTDEQKETMAREHFTEVPAVINSGIMCENGFYIKSEQKDAMPLGWRMNVRYNYPWFSIYSLILASDTSPIVEQK